MRDPVERHEHAAVAHELAARRYEEAAQSWDERGDVDRGDSEWRKAEIQRAAATFERERARVEFERSLKH
jgi:hypothetical protein